MSVAVIFFSFSLGIKHLREEDNTAKYYGSCTQQA